MGVISRRKYILVTSFEGGLLHAPAQDLFHGTLDLVKRAWLAEVDGPRLFQKSIRVLAEGIAGDEQERVLEERIPLDDLTIQARAVEIPHAHVGDHDGVRGRLDTP